MLVLVCTILHLRYSFAGVIDALANGYISYTP